MSHLVLIGDDKNSGSMLLLVEFLFICVGQTSWNADELLGHTHSFPFGKCDGIM